MHRVTDDELRELVGGEQGDPFRNWMQVNPPRAPRKKRTRLGNFTVGFLFLGVFLYVATLFWMEAWR